MNRKHSLKRWLCLLLAAAMLTGLLPAGALAAQVPGGTVTLAVGAAQQTPAVQTGEPVPVYLHRSSISTELPSITVRVDSGSSGARVQAVDGSGQVVGQTAGFSLYSSANTLDRTELFLLDQLDTGDYPLQLVYGEKAETKTLEGYVLRVTDAPVITGGYLNLHTSGASELRLSVSGYRGDPALFSFQLEDEAGTQHALTGRFLGARDDSDYGSVSLYWSLDAASIQADTRYSLRITASGGALYSNVAALSDTPYDSGAGGQIAVIAVEPDKDVVGGLRVRLGGAEAGTAYSVSATDQNDDTLCREEAVVPEFEDGVGVLRIVLKKNGIQLPLSVYNNLNLNIRVQSPSGAADYGSYYTGYTYINQYSRLTLRDSGDGSYCFTLEGVNLYGDLYAKASPAFELACYDQEAGGLTVLASAAGVTKEKRTGPNTTYRFTGTFTPAQPLASETYYQILSGGEALDGTQTIEGQPGSLYAASYSMQQFDWDDEDSSFWFNFGLLPLLVTYSGLDSQTASAELYDTETGAAVSSAEARGEASEDGMTFRFELPQTDAVISGRHYGIRVLSGGETLPELERFSDMIFDGAADLPDSVYAETPVFQGDTSVSFRFYSSSVRNMTKQDLGLTLLQSGSELAVTATGAEITYSDNAWIATLPLDQPLSFGRYTYQLPFTRYSNSFTTVPKGAPALRYAQIDEEAGLLRLTDCRNLPEGTYTAVLCDVNELGRGKLRDLSLTRVSAAELTAPASALDGVENGYYSLEVSLDGSFLGAVGLSVNSTNTSASPVRGYNWGNGGEIVYETTSEAVCLLTSLPGYDEVRYSEDRSFAGADYHPIRERYQQKLTLSSGNGLKTVYVQFRTLDGSESEVYTWTCCKTDHVSGTNILGAWLESGGSRTDHVESGEDFTLRLVSSTRLTGVYAKFIRSDGSAYYESYPLSYQGEYTGTLPDGSTPDEGYLFETVLNAGSYPFGSSYYSFRAVELYLTGLSGYSWARRVSLPLYFGEAEIRIEGLDGSTLYSAASDVLLRGTATAGSTVTVRFENPEELTDPEFTAQAGTDGSFSVELPGLEDGQYDLSVSDGTLSTIVWLTVDTTPPEVTSFTAIAGSGGSAALSWSCSEWDVRYRLWRGDALVCGDDFTDTTYIAANALGETFSVQAEDRAGNVSEKRTVTVGGDEEPPTAPGAPGAEARTFHTMKLKWESATDNIAVWRYEVWRDGVQLAVLRAQELSYQDSGLSADTAYNYAIYALDRSGNRSEAAQAELRTAKLEISSATTFAQTYIKEETTNGIPVSVRIRIDGLYPELVDGCRMQLEYRAADAQDWETAVLADAAALSGRWSIEDLAPGDYQVRFRVAHTEGEEAFSPEQTVRIEQDAVPPTISISEPASGITRSGKALKLSGRAADNVELARVELHYTLGGKTAAITTLTNEAEGAKKKSFFWSYLFEAGNLPSGEITITATAFDARGNRASEEVSLTLDNTPPEAPYGFQVAGDSEKISVLWNYPAQSADSDFSSFRVYRAEQEAGPFEAVSSQKSINYYDSVRDTGIETGKTYYYHVTAVDRTGNESEPTATLCAAMTEDHTPPLVVSVLPAQNYELCRQQTLSVSVADNSMLRTLKIEYRRENGADWTELASFELHAASVVQTYDWDISAFTAGACEVRYTVTDAAGLQASRIVSYTIRAYQAPAAPVLTVRGDGHRAAALSWTYPGEEGLLGSMHVLRRGEGETAFRQIAVLGAGARSYRDAGLVPGGEYEYQIRAVDRWKAEALSTAQRVIAPNQDTEPPLAVIAADNLLLPTGAAAAFCASGSSDNDAISSYAWDFGDGQTASGASVTHAFAAAGTYSVTLTVTDPAGNRGTASVGVMVMDPEAAAAEGIRPLTIRVVNASDGVSPIAGAELHIVTQDGSVTTLVSDGRGEARLLLRDGSYRVQALYADYLARTLQLQVNESMSPELLVELGKTGMMTGSLTSKELTYQEIVAAGIDVSDPDNQHVYRFSTVLHFTPEDKVTYEIPFNYYVNTLGVVLGTGSGGGGGGTGGGILFRCGKWSGRIYPVSRDAYLIIYGEARWLKEMFQVQLLLNNSSKNQTAQAVTAELEIPEGLSLAAMTGGPQTRRVSIGTIAPETSRTTNWYLRGDREGKYALRAAVNGLWMPGSEPFTLDFVTDQDLEVLGGSALHLYVEAERSAKKGQDYRVNFRLENVSDKELYHVSLNVFGGTFLQKYTPVSLEYQGRGGDLSGIWNQGNGAVSAETLAPGESIGGTFKIVFDADYMADDVRYLLSGMFTHTMEGSTTEIPTTITYINREDLAIVVVPGIMGSELYRTTEEASLWEKVWIPQTVDAPATLFMNGRIPEALLYLGKEALLFEASQQIGTDEAKTWVGDKWNTLLHDLDTLQAWDKTAARVNFSRIKVREPSSAEYGTARSAYEMMESLRTVTENVYLYSYDWRNDNAVSAGGLDAFIRSLKAQGKDVVIVAHSMGGLVTSSYVQQYGADNVEKIITCGTPYFGTPKGAYMMELIDNADKLVGDLIAKGFGKLAAFLLGKELTAMGASKLQEWVAKELFTPIFEEAISPAARSAAQDYLDMLQIPSLVQYYQGLYQLLPSKAFGRRYICEPSLTWNHKDFSEEQEQAFLENMMEHYRSNSDHIREIQKAYAFHEALDESWPGVHPLLALDKTWFIVGAGVPTIDRLVRDVTEAENGFSDVLMGSGDGTVVSSSATMNGAVPRERTLYLQTNHGALFSDSTAINAVKGLLYDETDLFEQHSDESNPLPPYTKIKVECPVDVTITRGGETLCSSTAGMRTQTGFGELYLLGNDLDIKVAILRDDTYQLSLLATGSGSMKLTVEYYDGVNNETPTASRVFSDVPLTAGAEMTAQIPAAAALPGGSTGGPELRVDNDGDGRTDAVLLPDSGRQPDPAPVDPTPGSGSGTKPAQKPGQLPEVDAGTGGSAEVKPDGKLDIRPDDGYKVDKVYVNGKPYAPEDVPVIRPGDAVRITFTPADGVWRCPFRDVTEGAWYYDAVRYVTENGLFQGTSADRFSPDGSMTRAMLAAVLWRLEGQPAAQDAPSFTDAVSGAWYEKAIAWAASEQIMQGVGAGRFAPDARLTREQIAAVLYRYAGWLGHETAAEGTLSAFSDGGEVASWARDAFIWASETGLVTGKNGGRLDPKGSAKRAEVAAILQRFALAFPQK